MPVRSLSSSVLKWPDRQTVEAALRRWADRVARRREDVLRIGYFGSYARGDWGVGSDLDILIVVRAARAPFESRSTEFDATELPVPADLLVYTREEWEALGPESRFGRTLHTQAVWLFRRDEV
jgi:predicted nucleotidyltransferase